MLTSVVEHAGHTGDIHMVERGQVETWIIRKDTKISTTGRQLKRACELSQTGHGEVPVVWCFETTSTSRRSYEA
jgi:hypothetical protein